MADFGAGARYKATGKAHPKKKKAVKVSVPYAPTAKGKKAEREDRGHVTVPYAPTPTGKAAEKKASRARATHKKAAKQRAEARAIAKITGPQSRATERGTSADPYAYKPPAALATEVERKVVEPLKKAGYHKTTGQKAYQRVAEYGPYLVPELGGLVEGVSTTLAKTGAKELASKAATSEAESSAKTLLQKATGSVKGRATARARAVKTAPRRAAERVKETPKRVKTAPRRAKKAVSTKEGRKAVAKGGAKKAAKHPVRTGYGAAAVSPIPLPGELDKRAQAFAEGTYDATVNHPKQVAETTTHGVIGGLTAPLAIAGAGVESVKQGSFKPLAKESKTLATGVAHMASNLASGDPKKVEHTTLTETGWTPFIPVPHIARRLKGTKAYEDTLRGGLRGKVEGVRAKTRDKRIEAQKAAQEAGAFVPRARAKKVRHAVPDSRRAGENYVLRRTGKRIEKQRSRHRLSREVTRMEEEGTISGGIAGSRVMKALKKSKGANREAQNYGDAMRIFLKHGLPRDEARGTALVQMLHDQWPKIEHGDVPIEGVHLDRHSTKFILDHPEIFKDKHFWKAIEAFDAESKRVGTSPRNQFLAQVHSVINPLLKKEGRTPILTPEEMIPPAAVKLLPKREKPWSREAALDYVGELKQVKDHSRPQALAKAKAIEGELGGLMKPPKHGGAEHGVSTTRAVAWTPEMERAFVKAARREITHFKLREPAPYVADFVPSTLKGGESLPAYGGLHPVNKVWPSQGKAARSGNAESSLESLIYHSLESPHSRKASVRGLKRIFDFSSREVTGRRYLTQKQFEHALNTHQVPDGVIPVRTQMLSAMLEGDHPVDPVQFHAELMKEVEHGQKLIAGEQLAGEMAATKELGVKGEKFAPMDAVAIHELMGHMKGPQGAAVYMGHATNFATRAILNSPAFELAQFAQEGIPMAAALGRDVSNVPMAVRNLAEIGKLDPQTQAMIRATAGSSVGVLGAPKLKAWRSQGFMDPARAAGGKAAWQHAWEIVNGDKLGRFDRARAGMMREAGAMSRIEGDFKRAEKGFRAWRSSANNLFKDMNHAVEEMRGMTPLERHAYVAEHPELGDRLMKSMSGMAGNWNSFTVFEKNIAPFTIFYPFQRYSVLWALYHFPLDHPVVATGLAMLGEVNAQELQKIAAKTGSVPSVLDYAKPVVNGHVLPAGQRFSAVLGSVQQAVLEGNPMEAIGSLSPALGIPLEAIAGKNAFTGAPLGESGWAYLAHQGFALSPFARFLGSKVDVPFLTQEKSPGSKLFASEDPNRAERSFVNPYIGQSGEQFANEKRLERKFGEKYGEGKVPYYGDSPLYQKIRYGKNAQAGNVGAVKRELADALKTIHGQEGASNFIKHGEKKYYAHEKEVPEGLAKLIQETFENAYQTGPNGEGKKSGNPYTEALESSKKGNVYLEALDKQSGGNAYLEALK